ncbi:MAG: type II secretion system F family protein, partial [Candidatus Thiodiazotropha sp. (ex Lucinoma borealis)]|nr:type II secretion system F family protein [Candidatus Thiodiazotropha sp. (ex Lucinoma borealis)]
MASFLYKAVGADGEIVEGELQAVSRDHAVNQIHLKGQVPIRVIESQQKGNRAPRRRLRRSKVPTEQIASFTRELSTLLKSGQP